MKRALTASIILRFPTADSVQLVAAIERCLDAAGPEERFSINWNYPLHTLLSDSSSRAENVVSRLKARRTDTQLPMGFSGAYHGLLSAEELKREIQWAGKNPWGEDLETAYGSDLEILFPLSVDLIRPPIRRIYAAGPTILVADRDGERMYAGDGETFQSLPAITASRIENRHLVELPSFLPKRDL